MAKSATLSVDAGWSVTVELLELDAGRLDHRAHSGHFLLDRPRQQVGPAQCIDRSTYLLKTGAV